jgi:hypothetical protein
VIAERDIILPMRDGVQIAADAGPISLTFHASIDQEDTNGIVA